MMSEFILWSIVCMFIIFFGIYCRFANKAIVRDIVKDIKAYNHKLSNLAILYALLLEIIGVPLLKGQNSPFVIISILGTMLLSITCIGIYVVKIEPKHKK